jgi:hypothetical protein
VATGAGATAGGAGAASSIAAGAEPVVGAWSLLPQVQFQTQVQLPLGAMVGASAQAPFQFHTQVHSSGAPGVRGASAEGEAVAGEAVSFGVGVLAGGREERVSLDAVAAAVVAVAVEAAALAAGGEGGLSLEVALGVEAASLAAVAAGVEAASLEAVAAGVATWPLGAEGAGLGASAAGAGADSGAAGVGAGALAGAAGDDSPSGLVAAWPLALTPPVELACVTAPSSPGLSTRTETFTLPSATWMTGPLSPGLSTRTETLTLPGAATSSARAGPAASTTSAPVRRAHRRRRRVPAIAGSMPPNRADDPCNRR